MQAVGLGQLVHAMPLEPQAWLLVPRAQLPCWQQPVGHERSSQTQPPSPTQRWPIGQAGAQRGSASATA
jgi:hypothetical protein